MARDLIRFSSDKKGFAALLTMEALVAVWALTATFAALRAGEKRTAACGLLTAAATLYILGRGLRGFLNIVRREREERAAGTNGGGSDGRQG